MYVRREIGTIRYILSNVKMRRGRLEQQYKIFSTGQDIQRNNTKGRILSLYLLQTLEFLVTDCFARVILIASRSLIGTSVHLL